MDKRSVAITTKPNSRYYTYLLCYPSRIPFYVGKGTGKRADSHLKTARNYEQDKTDRGEVIRDLTNNHIPILILYDMGHGIEHEAYVRESALISFFAPSGLLTNKTQNGYLHNWEKHRRTMFLVAEDSKVLSAKYRLVATCTQKWDTEVSDSAEDTVKDFFRESVNTDEYFLFYRKIRLSVLSCT